MTLPLDSGACQFNNKEPLHMRLTTKGRYAVTSMLDLAINSDHGPVPLADISRRQSISISYLEQIFSRLRKNGLVDSARGPGGGYRLSRTPELISIANVIDAVDEKVDTTRCGGKENCDGEEKCLTHELWADLSAAIYQFLDGISIATLLSRGEVQLIAARQHGDAKIPEDELSHA